MSVLAVRQGTRRRRPWPNDMIISGQPVMLGRPNNRASTPVISKKPQDLSGVVPQEYGETARSPLIERPITYADLSLGMGLKVQDGGGDRRYAYALNADLSVSASAAWCKGPAITTLTPATTDSTNGVSKFFEIGGNLYALAGRYCLYRSSDSSWPVSKDFGSGKAAVDVEVFNSNGTGTIYAFVAMGDAEKLYYFSGATTTTVWTQHATLYARAFAKLGSEFYRAHDTNLLAKVDTDADPTDDANWTADNAFRIGDRTSGVVRLAKTADGSLIVFKTDGVYTLTEAGQDVELYPNLRLATDNDNGKATGVFLNDLYVNYLEGFYRLVRNGDALDIEAIGPERLQQNDSVVKGRITAFAGHANFHAYAGLYNPDTGNSYLMKFGSYVNDQVGRATRVDAWHGSISAAYASKKITALYKSKVGAATGHYRLYMGFSDGTIGWFTLPCVANPAACTSYTFSTADGEVYLPTFHGGFRSEKKNLRSFSIAGTRLSSTNYAQMHYQEDPDLAYTSFGTDFDTTPSEIASFATGVFGSLIDLKIILKSSSSASCPLVTSATLYYQVRPPLFEIYEFDVLTENGLVRHDGSPLRQAANAIRETLRANASSASTITVVFPDESEKEMTVIDHSERLAWNDRTRSWQAAIHVVAAETVTSATNGTIARLRPYTVDDLAGLSILGLESL